MSLVWPRKQGAPSTFEEVSGEIACRAEASGLRAAVNGVRGYATLKRLLNPPALSGPASNLTTDPGQFVYPPKLGRVRKDENEENLWPHTPVVPRSGDAETTLQP